MRFVVDQSVIAPAVAAAARIVPSKPVFPALEGVLLKASNDSITVKTTSLEASMELLINTQIEEEGEALVSAKLLNSLLHKLYGGLMFQTNGNVLEISTGKTDVKALTYDPENIPSLGCASNGGLTFKSREWKDILRKTLLQTFKGVFFDLKEDVITVMATDNYRLTLLDVFYPGCGTGDLFVSREQIEKLLPLLSDGDEDVDIYWNDSLITFRSQQLQFIFTGRRTIVKMPNYTKILPKNKVAARELDRGSAAKTFERAALFSAGSIPPPVCIKCNGSGTLDVSIKNASIGSLKETLPCEGEGGFEASYNPSFLCDALKSVEAERIALEMYEHNILEIKSGNYSVIVLPVVRKSEVKSEDNTEDNNN